MSVVIRIHFGSSNLARESAGERLVASDHPPTQENYGKVKEPHESQSDLQEPQEWNQEDASPSQDVYEGHEL